MFKIIAALLLIVKLATCQQACSYESNVDFNGADITFTAVNWIDECCALCNRESACVAWTFVKPTGLCYLKSDLGVRRLNSPESKHINHFEIIIIC